MELKQHLFQKLFVAGALLTSTALTAQAAKNVWCMKTDAGKYIEMARVSMIVITDGKPTFEIVVRDGEGAVGVQSVSFEKHASDIDLSQYKVNTDGTPAVNASDPVWLQTNTGKNILMKNVSLLANVDATGKFEVVTKTGNETGVSSVSFYKCKESLLPTPTPTAIRTLRNTAPVEQLQLQTPVSSQLTLSGCGNATKALLYSTGGKQVGSAPVSNGATTLQVGHLPAGVYVVKVGNKSLKFIKK